MSAPLHRELPASLLDSALALSDVTRQWDGDIVRQITDYIGIPAKSPGFDADWLQHGYIDTVVRNAAAWVEAQKVPGLMLEIRIQWLAIRFGPLDAQIRRRQTVWPGWGR